MPCPKASLAPSCEIDFDNDGKHHGYIRIQFSSDRSAYGWIPVPVMSIRNGAGPCAIVIGANHGDEYEGVSICNELYQTLGPHDISGQVIFLPAANAPAYYSGRRTSPVDWTGEANLNRLFPGNQYGSPTEMIAWYITNQLVHRADAIFDLHSAGKSIDHHPSVKIRLMGVEDKDALQMKFLHLFGAPLGIVGNRVHETTLSGEALPRNVIYVSTELGGAGKIRPWIRDFAFNGMKRCLREMGILPSDLDLPEPEHAVRLMEMQTDENYIYANKDGMFEPRVNLGDDVEDGQFAGYIWSLKEPWLAPERLHFKKGGVVFCKRTPALCEVGDTLFFTLNGYRG
ncbi:MAG: succinylglutamate desuccinylase/aspartoacylase family protein [Rhodobacteraceae bacterium]|nr:succinylglutamate desuccinylase/aspartoacylase family protein [Paracoccaceae bacterium]MCY4139985.1 succinylglutamate desuccinylase/aspartoacylase family protein [Paracoccaceae bacterium]